VTTGPATEELRPALAAALSAVHDHEVDVIGLERRRSEYRSSFGLEELDVTLDDGTELALVFKDLGWETLDAEGRRAKPPFLYEPQREIGVYRNLLAGAGLGTATYHGSTVDEARGRFWLFVERVAGVELYQVGDVARWEEAARRLAGTHAALAGDPERSAAEAHLLRHDADFYGRWMERALEFARQGERPASERHRLESLAARYDAVVDGLLALPRGVIHGELYASNVLDHPADDRVCPVDWEMAAIGPPLLDLAALTTGWDPPVQARLEHAYADALDGADAWPGSPEASAEALALCRLALSIQWLGWAEPGWSPPQDHRRDWLGDAVLLADRLGL
jgi:hypothetical protein